MFGEVCMDDCCMDDCCPLSALPKLKLFFPRDSGGPTFLLTRSTRHPSVCAFCACIYTPTNICACLGLAGVRNTVCRGQHECRPHKSPKREDSRGGRLETRRLQRYNSLWRATVTRGVGSNLGSAVYPHRMPATARAATTSTARGGVLALYTKSRLPKPGLQQYILLRPSRSCNFHGSMYDTMRTSVLKYLQAAAETIRQRLRVGNPAALGHLVLSAPREPDPRFPQQPAHEDVAQLRVLLLKSEERTRAKSEAVKISRLCRSASVVSQRQECYIVQQRTER